MNEPETALQYYQRAHAIMEQMNFRRGEAMVLGNLGNLYVQLRHYQGAIACYEQELAIMRAIKDEFAAAIAAWNLGAVLRQDNNRERALQLMAGSIAYLHTVNYPPVQLFVEQLQRVQQRLFAQSP